MMNYSIFRATGFFLALGLISTTICANDKPPENSMPMSQILLNIQKQGFDVVLKIEYNNGRYLAKAFNNHGDQEDLEIAPQSGEIIKPKVEDRNQVSIIDATKKVEQAGYNHIYNIDTSKEKYTFKAYNSSDKKMTIDVNAKTGEIKQ